MKHLILAAVLAAAAIPAHAAVYACKDASGRVVYTQNPGDRHCQVKDLGKPSVYSSLPAPAAAPAPQAGGQGASVSVLSAQPEAQVSEAQINAARERVRNAKKALEEGKKIRNGNERNYAKYLERIENLERDLKQAQESLAALLGQGSGGMSSF